MAGGAITAGIFNLISGIFGAKSDTTKGMVEVAKVVIEGDMKRQDGITQIAVAEQKYGNYLSRNWRPATAVLFIMHYFLIIHGILDVPAEIRTEILMFMSSFILGLGGVRSVEKIFSHFTSRATVGRVIDRVLKRRAR